MIESVKFHPNGQIAMTAGLDKTLHLFQVDGKVNEKIQSVHFNDMPIHSASFSPDGRTIFASGRRKFFYSYDVEAGAITHIPAIAGHTEKSLESMIVSPNGEFLAFMVKILARHFAVLNFNFCFREVKDLSCSSRPQTSIG